jgi:hypothetical protein
VARTRLVGRVGRRRSALPFTGFDTLRLLVAGLVLLLLGTAFTFGLRQGSTHA